MRKFDRKVTKMQYNCAFPEDFLWGAATASYQVEGYPLEDDAGPSNWHTFTRRPGAIANDDTGDITSGQYHKLEEDIALMKWMGIKAYRFSIAWPRIFPESDGQPNQKGLDHYNRLIDGLLKAGIEPWPTLFHWDLPQTLEDRWGGWQSADTARAFADYAGWVTKSIGDRVGQLFTINEISSFIGNGYQNGKFPPGLQLDKAAVAQAMHHACLAHGLGVQAIRAQSPRPLRVGIAEVVPSCVPVIETPENIEATHKAFRRCAASRLVPMQEGAYPDFWLEEMGDAAPRFTDQEMATIAEPCDFVGINMYAPDYILADPESSIGYRVLDFPPGYPTYNMPWLRIGPQITYWVPRLIHESWNVPSIYISENGCACQDRIAPDGQVYDTDRVMYLREHFQSAQRAIADGVPLHGYFVWSLMDNFEWASGLQKRFGLVYVNYSNLERTPKLSAKFFREVISRKSIV